MCEASCVYRNQILMRKRVVRDSEFTTETLAPTNVTLFPTEVTLVLCDFPSKKEIYKGIAVLALITALHL